LEAGLVAERISALAVEALGPQMVAIITASYIDILMLD
jgi:hypothetical protein